MKSRIKRLVDQLLIGADEMRYSYLVTLKFLVLAMIFETISSTIFLPNDLSITTNLKEQ